MVRWNTSIFPVYADAGAAMDGEDVLLREITLEAHDTLSETVELNFLWLFLIGFNPFRYISLTLCHSLFHCFRVLRRCLWSNMWSKSPS